MKRLLLIGLVILTGAQVGMTQKRDRRDMQDRRERLETMKIGYITQQLDLTAEEAQKFWPVYNEYEAKMEEGREPRPAKSEEEMSESEARQWIESSLKHETEMVEMRKAYVAKLLEVIPAVKVVRLFEAERKFRREVIDHVRKRMEEGGPPPKE